MTKKTFHYICMLFISLFVFSIDIANPKALEHISINYYGVEITRDEYLTLLNLGFDENEIYYMTEEIFNENKDLDATLLAQTQKYYKTVYPTYGNSYTVEVTEDEFYNHENNTLGQTVTSYETVKSSISANGSMYRYKVTQSWDSNPSTKSYDVIAIGFNNMIHINGGTTFYNMYTTSSGNTTTSYTYYNKLNTGTGGTTTYKLPSSFVGGSAIYYFNVAKDSGAGTITSLYMCGDYAHAFSNVTGNQAASHLIDINGIDFSSSVYNYFDEIPCATTYMGVTW